MTGTSLREKALREALEEAGNAGYVACAETRHVTLGEKVRSAIRALAHDRKGERNG